MGGRAKQRASDTKDSTTTIGVEGVAYADLLGRKRDTKKGERRFLGPNRGRTVVN